MSTSDTSDDIIITSSQRISCVCTRGFKITVEQLRMLMPEFCGDLTKEQIVEKINDTDFYEQFTEVVNPKFENNESFIDFDSWVESECHEERNFDDYPDDTWMKAELYETDHWKGRLSWGYALDNDNQICKLPYTILENYNTDDEDEEEDEE